MSGAPATRRGQSLSVRLALLLSVAVVAVLLVTGVVVNRVVSRSLVEELSAGQRDRITLLAQELEGVNLDQPRVRRAVEIVLERVARQARGRAEILAADGSVLVVAGGTPRNADTERLEETVPGDAGWVLAVEVPAVDQPFLRVFNTTLIVAGGLAVAALLLVSTLLSERLTRPLRGVAAAARQLGAGNLAARAEGGPDRESAELAESFNAMASRLERSEALRRRAASDMAHDLATPATVLESQLQAMVDGVVPADREQLEQARAAASAMSGVIVQLRDLVDAEAATLQRRPERFAAVRLVADAAGALDPLFRERGVAVEVAVDAAPEVEADRLQAARALRNLLANAAQHSPRGGRIAVGAVATPDGVVLRVHDEGGGIDQADLPHVFERFYRADPARPRQPDGGDAPSGSGIGLTIARELVRANGGDVWVERTGADGTTMALRLPEASAG